MDTLNENLKYKKLYTELSNTVVKDAVLKIAQENNKENLKYKKLYMELSTIISKWWDKYEYGMISVGEGDFDNIYNNIPDFVIFIKNNTEL